MKIEHCSFGVWNTLIKENKNSFKEIINIWVNEFGIIDELGIIEESIMSNLLSLMSLFFRGIDIMGERHSNLKERMYFIYTLIGLNQQVTEADLDLSVARVYPKLEEVILDNPPHLYDEDTMDVLLELRDRKISMNILSNTGFIEGRTIDKILEILGIDDLFDFKLYSDEMKQSKPSRNCFDKIPATLNIPRNNILHIGDDPMTDGGALQADIRYLQINTNSNSIIKVLDLI